MGKLSSAKPTYKQGGGSKTGGTRRRAYPSVDGQTVLREGAHYGKRGNARHHYDKKEKGKK